jgi:hypothetical protein
MPESELKPDEVEMLLLMRELCIEAEEAISLCEELFGKPPAAQDLIYDTR